MCACFDLAYVLSDISDDGRTASTVQRERHASEEYQPFLPPVSEQELCERVRQRVPVSMSTIMAPTQFWLGVHNALGPTNNWHVHSLVSAL